MITLSRPVVVKQLPGPSLPNLMAQFNIDVDSGHLDQPIHTSYLPGHVTGYVVAWFSRAFPHIVPVGESMMKLFPQVGKMVVQ